MPILEWRGWGGERGPEEQALREETIHRIFALFDELDCPPSVAIEACATLIGVAIGKAKPGSHAALLKFTRAEINRVIRLLRPQPVAH